MTATTEPPPRIAALDIVRGVAVMGILAMNVIGFALPDQAYLNPTVYGMESRADFLSWLASFVLVDGKMRGLFSALFGASLLLVLDKAEAKGESAARVHFRRMAWLLLFGLLHMYLVWYGDILTGYAVMGMAAWFFAGQEPRALLRWGAGLVLFEFLLMGSLAGLFFTASAVASAPGAAAAAVAEWNEMRADFVLDPKGLADALALYRGSYGGLLHHRLTAQAAEPLWGMALFGWETLGYMLLGMAGLKTGFLTGAWPRGAYWRVALAGFAIGVPAYALLAWLLVRGQFAVPLIFAAALAGPVLVRPVMVAATAALILLLTGGGGWLVRRIAAAGRAAFTNYLGTSIVMTSLFYGYGGGLFGTMGRAELWLVVAAMWALMLLWSKPWLDRFHYGPFEWLWRSLARGAPQPMRRDRDSHLSAPPT